MTNGMAPNQTTEMQRISIALTTIIAITSPHEHHKTHQQHLEYISQIGLLFYIYIFNGINYLRSTMSTVIRS